VGQWALSPFRNQKSSFFCQLAKYIRNFFFKSSLGPIFEHSGSATEFGSFKIVTKCSHLLYLVNLPFHIYIYILRKSINDDVYLSGAARTDKKFLKRVQII
jgi:hypothetical protein